MKYKRIIVIIIGILLMLQVIMPTKSLAAVSVSDMFNQADKFIETGKNSATIDQDKLSETFIPIAQILTVIGTVVIAVSIAILAIKYMTSNPEDKAKVKSKLVGLVVATVVIYGAYGIWSLLYNTLKDIL